MVLGGLVLFLVPTLSEAGVPGIVHFQGFLTDDGGQPLSGTYSVLFSIYDVESEGTALWSEQHSVSCDDGFFSLTLGPTNPIDLTFSSQYWLGIKVESNNEMTPRYQLSSVPYAFWTAIADSALNAGVASFAEIADSSAIAGTSGYCSAAGVADSALVAGSAGTATASEIADSAIVAGSSVVAAAADSANGVRWANISGMPADFADGVDDEGAAGDHHSLDASDGDPVDAIYVNDDGWVGIGINTPTRKLHVHSLGGDVAHAQFTNWNTGFDANSGLILGINGAGHGYITHRTIGKYLYMGTNNSTDLTITPDGDVGIGSLSPSSKLDVFGTVEVQGFQMITGATDGYVLTCDGSGVGTWQASRAGAMDEKWFTSGDDVIFDPAGDVGIATRAPQRKLHVGDAIRLEPLSSAPSNPAEGDMYMDATTHKLMVYDGSTWRGCW
jgi:hypothetical protein